MNTLSFPTADLAEFFATLFAGNDFAVSRDDTTVTLDDRSLAHLRSTRTEDEDGYYDGTHVWIEGDPYAVEASR